MRSFWGAVAKKNAIMPAFFPTCMAEGMSSCYFGTLSRGLSTNLATTQAKCGLIDTERVGHFCHHLLLRVWSLSPTIQLAPAPFTVHKHPSETTKNTANFSATFLKESAKFIVIK